MAEPRIALVEYVPAGPLSQWGNVQVNAVLEDGTYREAVIYYYDDEILVPEHELVGHTVAQARDNKCRIDADYLRS